jgi:hypothetical protein
VIVWVAEAGLVQSSYIGNIAQLYHLGIGYQGWLGKSRVGLLGGRYHLVGQMTYYGCLIEKIEVIEKVPPKISQWSMSNVFKRIAMKMYIRLFFYDFSNISAPYQPQKVT